MSHGLQGSRLYMYIYVSGASMEHLRMFVESKTCVSTTYFQQHTIQGQHVIVQHICCKYPASTTSQMLPTIKSIQNGRVGAGDGSRKILPHGS